MRPINLLIGILLAAVGIYAAPLSAGGGPSDDTPVCSTHDALRWHALYDAARDCHYDHEHKDDPNRVNEVFGVPGGWFGAPGQSISYPWQTFKRLQDGTVLYENDVKHTFYGWQVRADMPCIGILHAIACVTDFRTTFHMNTASPGAVTRFHSFSLEARACLLSDPSQCGTLRSGGWMDIGHLLVRGEHVALEGDPETLSWFRRHHQEIWDEYPDGNPYAVSWYGRHPFGEFSAISHDAWGLTDAADPFALQLHCPDYRCSYNGSQMFADNLSVVINQLAADEDGLITYRGFADMDGNLIESCAPLSHSCIPIKLKDWPQGFVLYRDDAHGIEMREYDTSPAATGTGSEWWITYPLPAVPTATGARAGAALSRSPAAAWPVLMAAVLGCITAAAVWRPLRRCVADAGA